VLGLSAVGGKQEQVASISAAEPWIHFTAAPTHTHPTAKLRRLISWLRSWKKKLSLPHTLQVVSSEKQVLSLSLTKPR